MIDRLTSPHARRRRALAPALLLLAGASACIHGSIPARELYRLTIPDSLAPGAVPVLAATNAGAPLAGTLAIARWRTPGLYGERSIVYRIDDTQYGAYPSREWAIPVADQLGVLTEAVLRRAPLARDGAIFDPQTGRGQEFTWRGTVREFEEVDRGKAVFAAVRMEALVVRTRDDSVLWSGAVRLERPVPAGTMPAIVATLSALSGEAVAALVADARRRLGTAPLAPQGR